MGRLLTAVVALGALGVLGAMAYYVLYGHPPVQETSAPKQQLDNVRAKAKQIEANDQQYVKDVEKKME